MVTSRVGEVDEVLSISYGADDYSLLSHIIQQSYYYEYKIYLNEWIIIWTTYFMIILVLIHKKEY